MLTRLQINRIEPFADGMTFGAAGSYVRLVGTAYGELDPQHPRNAVIVNIDKAPRNTRGCVEYDTDVYIMRPTDVSKGNRKLLYEVNNRGRKRLLAIFHEAPETSQTSANEPASVDGAGKGFFCRQCLRLILRGVY